MSISQVTLARTSDLLQSNQIAQVLVNASHGMQADGDEFFKHEASLQNQQPSNTSFLQNPMMRNLAPPPSSHFSLPSGILQSQPQRPSYPHPYPFPSQPVNGRHHMNEDPWRMPLNGSSADTKNGAWISGRYPPPGSHTVTDGMYM